MPPDDEVRIRHMIDAVETALRFVEGKDPRVLLDRGLAAAEGEVGSGCPTRGDEDDEVVVELAEVHL